MELEARSAQGPGALACGSTPAQAPSPRSAGKLAAGVGSPGSALSTAASPSLGRSSPGASPSSSLPSPAPSVDGAVAATPVAACELAPVASPCRELRPQRAGLDREAMRSTDVALRAKVDRGEAPGVVSMVFRRGVLAHLDAYGYADRERKLPMEADTIVRLYSMSKCLVSVAAARLVEDGALGLDEPVAKYIPAFAATKVQHAGCRRAWKAEGTMSVLHLMTHTSGIGYGPMLGAEPESVAEERYATLIERTNLGRTCPTDPRAITSLGDWCNELAKIPLLAHPGREWIYSYSHDVLGRVMEVASGEPLDALLERVLFRPLKMVDTSFVVPREKWGRFAGMYQLSAEPEDGPEDEACDEEAGEGDDDEGDEGDECNEGEDVDDEAGEDDDGDNEDDAGDEDGEEAEAEDEACADMGDEEGEEIDDASRCELERLDDTESIRNAWSTDSACAILAAGGSVDSITGGLVSTANDYSRFCLMLLRRGECDGVQILKPETVDLLCTNQLPRATGRDNVWCYGNAGVGFSLLGSVSVAHPDLDPALRPGEYGWGGMAGTAWTNDPSEDLSLLSFSLVAFDLSTEERLRAGVRAAIERFNEAEAAGTPPVKRRRTAAP